jgi:hypothetical protein
MKNTRQKRSAISIGISIWIMAILAMVSMGGDFGKLVQGEVLESSTIQSAILTGLVIWIGIAITDAIVSQGVCTYYGGKTNRMAMWSSAARYLYTGILGFAVWKIYLATQVENSESAVALLQQFESIWQLGLIVFGIHLILLAQIVGKSDKWIAVTRVLLLIAGIGYTLSNTIDLIVPSYESYRSWVEMPFILPMVVGELSWGLWLLFRGRRVSFTID